MLPVIGGAIAIAAVATGLRYLIRAGQATIDIYTIIAVVVVVVLISDVSMEQVKPLIQYPYSSGGSRSSNITSISGGSSSNINSTIIVVEVVVIVY